MKAKLMAPILSLAILSGCTTLAPEYSRPDLAVSTQLPEYSRQSVNAPLATDLAWQAFVLHPQLRQVIELTLENNRDLRTATLNVQRARALYRIEKSAQLPRVDGTLGGSNRGLSASQSGNGQRVTTHEYSAGLGIAAYELDLFGRVSNLKAQALQQYFASEQGRRAVEITLISGVANAYLTLTADAQRLQLAEDTLVSQRNAYDLQKQRHERGILSELELRQVQTQVDTARVEVARLQSQRARDANALRLLMGTGIPDGLHPDGSLANEKWFAPVSAGLSSEVLLKRPDVMQAEHQLKASNANIGVARAAFFPRISLTAGVGSASGDLSDLFQGSSQTWQFVPSLNLPIFNAGRNKANLEISKTDQKIAQAGYEQSIQRAFREVADSLAEKTFVADQLGAQQSLTEATEQTYKLAKMRYEQGVDSYLQVLDAQRSKYQAQQNLVQLEQAQTSTQLNLYKALGGGV